MKCITRREAEQGPTALKQRNPQGEAYGEILMLTLGRLLKAKNVDDNIGREACSTWNLSTNSAFDIRPRKTSGNV
jgi:hypothetical protein